jgi:hypothetical protein
MPLWADLKALALAIFYRALAMGAMGLTAALTGLLTALVPVLFPSFTRACPHRTAVGLAMGLIAIWLIPTRPRRRGEKRAPPAARRCCWARWPALASARS